MFKACQLPESVFEAGNGRRIFFLCVTVHISRIKKVQWMSGKMFMLC